MSDDLSIRAAALEHGAEAGLLHKGQAYTYQELAKLSDAVQLGTPNLIKASSQLRTALVLYKSLEQERALCLVAESASPQEVEKCAQRLAGASLADTALVLFSSGSGGLAKGVRLSHRALRASAKASEERLGWYGSDRWLCTLPLSHIGGLSILIRSLAARKCVMLCESFDTANIAAAIVDHQITHISLVPTMLWRLVESGFHAPPSLQVTLIGGAALPDDLRKRATDAGFHLRVSYGMTESASQIITDGQPLSGVEVRVREKCLELQGPMMMNGYLPPHQPETLAADSWFRTNDHARIAADGRVTVLGRADELIISGGENINPRDVEAALNRCSKIESSFALGLPHAEWGQELVALVVGAPQATDPDLQSHELSGHLRPKMLIRVQALPLLANGKIDRATARRLALAARDS